MTDNNPVPDVMGNLLDSFQRVRAGRVEPVVKVTGPDEFVDHFTVSGDLRAPGSGFDDDANNEACDALSSRFPGTDFDSESSEFFAYTSTQVEADAVAAAVQVWVVERQAVAGR